MPIVDAGLRDALWNDYNHFGHKICRSCFGTCWYLRHRVCRWWKIAPEIAVLQILYGISIAAIAVLTFSDSLPSTPKPQTPGWHKYVLILAAILIGWYKSKSSNAGQWHESERRQAVRSLFSKMNNAGAVDYQRLGPQHEARLQEICECVRRDAEEFLQISESQVGVIILKYVAPQDAEKHCGDLVGVARDRPNGNGYFGSINTHPAMETFSYEAIRRSRLAAFHDIRSGLMKRTFGKMNVDYRSVFCLPLGQCGANGSPFAILSLQFKNPYMLWPKAGDKLDRRLSLYLELITMFLSRD